KSPAAVIVLLNGLRFAADELAKLAEACEELHEQCVRIFVQGSAVIDLNARNYLKTWRVNSVKSKHNWRKQVEKHVDHILDNVLQKRLPAEIHGLITDWLAPRPAPPAIDAKEERILDRETSVASRIALLDYDADVAKRETDEKVAKFLQHE
ncbi:unnamed protein product, partial [Amoebophrya sp. A120]